MNVNGQTTIQNPGVIVGIPTGLSQFSGGTFTQGTNEGRRTRDEFGIVPEALVQVGYDLTHNIRAFVGYDFLYVNNVLRPADQVDPRINFTQQLGGTLVGAPAPAPRADRSTFWAQGISLGLTIRY